MEDKPYEHLAWDTSIFGYKVARITATNISPATITKLLAYLKENDYHLVYWSVKPENIFLKIFAEQAGGLLVDEKVTFATQLSPTLLSNRIITLPIESYTRTEPSAELLSLAFQSGTYSRFKRDSNFKDQEFEKLYTAWLKNSLNKESAREVFIYRQKEAIAGFISLTDKNKVGQIGLFAVAEQTRRMGIGSQLIAASLQRFYEWGYVQVLVSTQQKNRPAFNFYKKNGFLIQNTENIYHFWL
ncbi:hypothetical protein AHMF7605_12610 [Adhaeribacter arboris]|uniref:N-acetyltransferase domain-containing protein n=1 Tax=Adhaeribacter arboris TaxID=2072846 RepID=A0A2T2YFL3_9BACT|nr:GNAT family N-acetyltransferase [Adhaeribacter arboris]PSR54301.1 hypothetical protein AHMF7605_12610 [Adhaeribacter arboris]